MSAPIPTDPQTPTPEAQVEPQQEDLFSDAEAAFRYDPFSDPEEARRAAATPEQEEAAPAEPTPETPTPTPEPAAPAAPVTDPRMEQLLAATEALARASQLQSERASAPATPAAPPEDDLPPYNFQVPQELVDAILNPENPQGQVQGLNTLLRGSFRAAHKVMREEFNSRLEAIQKEVMGSIQQAVAQAVVHHQVHTDYYSKFPNHAHPAVQAVVREVLPQVVKELNAQGWSPSLRDALGERVNAHLRKITGQPDVPAVPPTQPTAPQPRPPALRPSNVRPQGGAPAGLSDEIHDVFSV